MFGSLMADICWGKFSFLLLLFHYLCHCCIFPTYIICNEIWYVCLYHHPLSKLYLLRLYISWLYLFHNEIVPQIYLSHNCWICVTIKVLSLSYFTLSEMNYLRLYLVIVFISVYCVKIVYFLVFFLQQFFSLLCFCPCCMSFRLVFDFVNIW